MRGFLTKKRILLFSFFLLILISRLYFLGSSLWHDDAFHIVDKAVTLAATGEYRNAHGTGYPLWIILLAFIIKIGHLVSGRWSVVFLPNLMTALWGSLLVFPIFSLANKLLKNNYYALAGTAVVLLNPVIWRWSEVAMSDIFALFCAVCSLSFFVRFSDESLKKYLWLSNLCLYLAMMSRVLYGLLLVPYFIFWIFSHFPKQLSDLQKAVYLASSWVVTVAAMAFSYGVLNDFALAKVFFSDYGSAMPTLGEFFQSSWIILKSAGILMAPLSILGLAAMLWKGAKAYFILYASISVCFLFYLAAWHRKGFFDIERYAMLLTIVLVLAAGYCLAVNKLLRIVFAVVVFVSLFISARGLGLSLEQYRTYGFSDSYLEDYAIKSAQLKQQTYVDADLQTYQDIAQHVTGQDIVLFWENDWAMPKLLLGGDHLTNRATLVSIGSEDDLRQALEQYRDRKIIFLRGAYETYLDIEDDRPVQARALEDRSVIHFVLPLDSG